MFFELVEVRNLIINEINHFWFYEFFIDQMKGKRKDKLLSSKQQDDLDHDQSHHSEDLAETESGTLGSVAVGKGIISKHINFSFKANISDLSDQAFIIRMKLWFKN